MGHAYYYMDTKPGALPEIHQTRNGITYVMAPPGTTPGHELAIRCDESGDAWISIRREQSGDNSHPLEAGEPLGHACLRVRRSGTRDPGSHDVRPRKTG